MRLKRIVICLVVLIGAIVLLAPIIVRFFDDSNVPVSAREALVLAQLSYLQNAFERFELDNGCFPPGTNGLDDLLVSPAWATNWHGPYIIRKFKDPWKHDYIYICPGQHTNEGYPYDLYTLGGRPFNRLGGNWQMPK